MYTDEVMKIKNIDLIIDAVAVLLGDYERHRKKAALLLLRVCLSDEFYKHLMEDEELKNVVKECE